MVMGAYLREARAGDSRSLSRPKPRLPTRSIVVVVPVLANGWFGVVTYRARAKAIECKRVARAACKLLVTCPLQRDTQWPQHDKISQAAFET